MIDSLNGIAASHIDEDEHGALEACPKRQGDRLARLENAFRVRAALHPEKVAVLFQGSSMTYGELDARSDRVAAYLAGVGCTRHSIVGICLERSEDLIVAILGVLKSGSAYLPLDPSYPRDRLCFMVDDSSTHCILSRPSIARDLFGDRPICDFDDAFQAMDKRLFAAPSHGGDADDLAYVIYTSGSTGTPKGVMVSHTPLALVTWATSLYTRAELACVAATSSISFDASVFEIFVPLLSGTTLLLKQDALDPYSPDESPTMLCGPPSIFGHLASIGRIPNSALVINLGGEPVARGLVDKLYSCSSVKRIFNHYGPTEATVLVTCGLVHRNDVSNPSIGWPIDHVEIYILDANLVKVAPDESGEVYIGGSSLAKGYLNRPQLAAERFVQNPFRAGALMYRTGDLGRQSANGEIHFLGRRDDQIKLRGYRIELGEIEAALMRVDGVRQAAAAVLKYPEGREQLVGYVGADNTLAVIDIKDQVSKWLPKYMVPGHIVVLDNLALTPSKKVDRAALPHVEQRNEIFAQDWMPPFEDAITSVFRNQLDISNINPNDSFFDLGGDSLLAINVALEIEKILGLSVSPALLAHDSSPKTLAAALANLELDDRDIITEIQPEGSEPPIFCTPDIYGRSLSFVSVGRRLAPHQPLYGLSAQPIHRELEDDSRIANITRAYADAIINKFPDRSYRIAGYSFGGPFALDLAASLEASGHDVELILIDAPIWRGFPRWDYVMRWVASEGSRALTRRGVIQTMLDIKRSRYIWRRWLSRNRKIKVGHVPGFVSLRDRPIAKSMLQALADFSPPTFFGPVLFIQGERLDPTASFLDSDGMLGWAELLRGPITRRTVPASHYQMMREPAVDSIAKHIGEISSRSR